MKKIFFLTIALGLLVSACGTSAKQAAPAGTAVNPSPAAAVDLNATAALMVQQTIQAMPTATLAPSNTPVVVTETPSGTPTPPASPTAQVTATGTQNPILLTLTATLGTGTPATIIPFNAPLTASPEAGVPTGTEYPRTYGTMPPDLPSGKIYVFNKANADVTISLHCTTKEGYTTIIEYPVEGKITVKAPAGQYHFVAWVGGKRYTGNFTLASSGDAMVIIYKDHVETK